MQEIHGTLCAIWESRPSTGVSSQTCRKRHLRTEHAFPSACTDSGSGGDGERPIVSLGNQTGEGWFLTGEMLELIHERRRRTSSAPSRSAACRTTSSAKASSKRLRAQLSEGEYHRRRLRSGGQRGQPAEPYQTDAFYCTEEFEGRRRGEK